MEVKTPVIDNWHAAMHSLIETVDIETGEVSCLIKTNLPLQAPGWTQDGTAIIANAQGRLYRIPVNEARTSLELIHAEGCFSSNNDHGVSPDGTLLAFTDMTRFGKSAIYVMPLSGGLPDLLTEQVPSWFHGWAPDGQSIVYTANRRGLWCIARTHLDTRQEELVIHAVPSSDHHYDSPEYTPDGEWIWFNSDRAGGMALWRMRPDGREAEQMSFGPGADWFPHPSPDGEHVVYLSYPQGTRGHPFGRDVELRLMPATGGPSRLVRKVYGGQGTINAPCWSPDGKRFAFARFDGPMNEPLRMVHQAKTINVTGG